MKRKSKYIGIVILIAALIAVIGYGIWYITVPTSDPEIIPKVEINYPDEEDEDGDGLKNQEEQKLGTNLVYQDTDEDGLGDYEEVHVHKTDPCKADTDKDGLADGVEVATELNPLKKKTDGKTIDADRIFDIAFEVEDCKLEVSGDANISNIYVGTSDYCNISNLPGTVSDLYEFYMEDMNFNKATVTFSYDDKKLANKKEDEKNLAIYQLLNNGTYKEVGGKVDVEKNTISVELKHFSKYFVADKTILNHDISTKVFLLLDNSGSMYNCFCQKPDCDGTSDICDKSDANDIEYKRVDMAKALIEQEIKNDVSFGIAKFTKDYMELKGGFNNTKKELLTSLDSIKTTKETFNGTYIANSIKEALNNFKEEDNSSRKFIVLLTDGETTENAGLFNWTTYDENNAIYDAQQKNVSIIVVGLGNSVDTEYLRKIAENTGGAYIYVNDSNALEKVHNIIHSQINYNMVDSDGDGVNDRILAADSGFDISKDALGFHNMSVELPYSLSDKEDEYINGGLCYGFSEFAQLYYADKLPLKASKVERHNGGGIFNPSMTQSEAANISSVEFFANTGKYANTEKDLSLFCPEVLECYNKYCNTAQKDRFERSGDKLLLSKELKDMFKEYKLFKIITKEVEGRWSVDKKKYTSYESLVITLDIDVSTLSGSEKDAYDVLSMIHNFWSEQNSERTKNDRVYSLNNTEEKTQAREEAFYTLIDDLKNGLIPIMSGPGHAINAIALYRDIENPQLFYLQCYNNSNPGTIQEVVIEQTKANKLALDIYDWLNDFSYKITDPENIFEEGENPVVDIDFIVIK